MLRLHVMIESQSSDDPSAREAVYEAFTDHDRDVEEAVRRALAAGRERLDADVGFFTRIEDGTQFIEVSVGDHPGLQPGDTCPFDRAYCRRTVEIDGQLSVQDAAASEAISQVAYETFQLGAYIGSKVVLEGEVYGTICFADRGSRAEPFSEAEELFVELIARQTGQALERRAHERELRERNRRLRTEMERFRHIAETSFDVLFRIDTGMTVSYVSEAIERVLGYEPEEVVGDSFREYLAPESVEAGTAIHERLVDGETLELYELTFRDADGEPVVLEVNARPIEEDGEVTSIQGVARDVTERRERESTLRVRTRAMDEADVGIAIADVRREDNPIVYANGAFRRLTGYSPAEGGGLNCQFLRGPATDEERVAELREHIQSLEAATVELVTYREDDIPFWSRVTITPVEDERGTGTHLLAFQEDVTERKRTERLLERLNRVLRHNLRNDMTVLLGYAERLRDVTDGAEIARRLETAVEDLLALADSARELQDIAEMPWRPRRLDLSTLLAEAATDVTDRRSDVTIDRTIGTDRDVCAGAELELAIAELLENAASYDTDPPTHVRVEARDEGGWVVLTITDDGPGIPETEASVIRTGRETPLSHGRGLGLWLVNWIVTRYGGSFQIDSREDGPSGTVATMRLPAIEPDEDVAQADERPTTLFR